MFSKLILPVLLFACLGITHGAVGGSFLKPIMQQHQNVMQLLLSSYSNENTERVAVSNNQAQVCFDYYSKKESALTETYNDEYLACLDAATAAKKALSDLNAEQRANITKQGNDLCSNLQSCQTNEDALDFFQCTYSAADVTTMVNISADSQSIALNIQKQYKNIDDNENICTVDCTNRYQQGLVVAIEDLRLCLDGKWTPPTDAPSTVPPTTQAPTTDEPTTEAPTTDEPTTEAPTTDEPTTEVTRPETEPTTEAPAVTTEDPESTDRTPEEDTMRYRQMTRMNMWNILRRL